MTLDKSAPLFLAWCGHDAAKYAVMRWHYSKAMPMGKLACLGVWEAGKFIGTVIFGRGSSRSLGTAYGMSVDQCCELVRVALKGGHRATVSRIVAVAIRLLRRDLKGLRLIVSYADRSKGHHGGIYQAGGWIYVGDSVKPDIMVNGKRYRTRSIGARYNTHSLVWLRKNVDPNAHYTEALIKHKYLMALDQDTKKQIAALARTYPKRVKS